MLMTKKEILQDMQTRLVDLVPAIEMAYKAELIESIQRLKKEKNAVVLGHNYMEAALYNYVADVRGDSLELARAGATVPQTTIVFCGVVFMAETAKILSPEKTVLIPSLKAGCSLASSISAEDVRELRRKYPGAPVVSYVNTYADVKAETDICCTSSNAASIIRSLDAETIIFLPDEYLARNVAKEVGKTIIVPTTDLSKAANPESQDKIHYELIGWGGRCEVHEQFTVEDIDNARRQFPDIFVLAHPECPPDVVNAADYSGSTANMIKHVRQDPHRRYLILTECSMADNIIAEGKADNVTRLCNIRCPHMAQISLEQTLQSLELNRYEVTLSDEIIKKAQLSLRRMVEHKITQ